MKTFDPACWIAWASRPIGWPNLNPLLVTLSISGYGHDGPEAGQAVYDQIAQGETGLMSLTGPDPGHPYRVGVPIGDLTAGIYGAMGACWPRSANGTAPAEGRSSAPHCWPRSSAFMPSRAPRGRVAGHVGHAHGNRHPSIAPYGASPLRRRGRPDRLRQWDGIWRRLCVQFGFDADDPDYATNADRLEHVDALTEQLEHCFADLDRDAVLAQLEHAGVPAGRIRSIDEVYQVGSRRAHSDSSWTSSTRRSAPSRCQA